MVVENNTPADMFPVLNRGAISGFSLAAVRIYRQ